MGKQLLNERIVARLLLQSLIHLAKPLANRSHLLQPAGRDVTSIRAQNRAVLKPRQPGLAASMGVFSTCSTTARLLPLHRRQRNPPTRWPRCRGWGFYCWCFRGGRGLGGLGRGDGEELVVEPPDLGRGDQRGGERVQVVDACGERYPQHLGRLSLRGYGERDRRQEARGENRCRASNTVPKPHRRPPHRLAMTPQGRKVTTSQDNCAICRRYPRCPIVIVGYDDRVTARPRGLAWLQLPPCAS